MSMTGEYRRITEPQLQGLLAAVREDPDAFALPLYLEPRADGSPDPELSIDEAWHAVHFLLNGDPWQITNTAGQAVQGGEEAGRDMSYGLVRFMRPAEVRRVAEALESVTREQFESRYDPDALNRAEIYPQGEYGMPDDLPRLWTAFAALRDFYRAAAQSGEAMLLYIA